MRGPLPATARNADAAGAVALYAPDGVFMPQHGPAGTGTAALCTAYDAVFGAIRLRVTFTIVEICQIAPDWAFARTTSAGTSTVLATGAGGPEANQELFVFQRVGGVWKIARYCFCTTNPPHAAG